MMIVDFALAAICPQLRCLRADLGDLGRGQERRRIVHGAGTLSINPWMSV